MRLERKETDLHDMEGTVGDDAEWFDEDGELDEEENEREWCD
jgi:hypothetical protein